MKQQTSAWYAYTQTHIHTDTHTQATHYVTRTGVVNSLRLVDMYNHVTSQKVKAINKHIKM